MMWICIFLMFLLSAGITTNKTYNFSFSSLFGTKTKSASVKERIEEIEKQAEKESEKAVETAEKKNSEIKKSSVENVSIQDAK